MAGRLNHQVADILRWLLVDLGLGAAPGGTWPVYATVTPDSPDNVITVIGTAGRLQGRTQTDGETQKHHGAQIRVRSNNQTTGFDKMNEISESLSKVAYQNTVTVESDTYLVHSVTQKTDAIPIGKEEGSNRDLFTLNVQLPVRKTS